MKFIKLSFFILFLFSFNQIQARTISIQTISCHKNPTTNRDDVISPEILIQGNGTDIICGSTSPSVADDTDFGSHIAGAANVVHTFTIQNTGDMDLDLVDSPFVQISGSSDFTITAQPTSPIAASGSTTFVVTFDPTTAGKQTATITITNNDVDEHFCTFLVKGIVSSNCSADNGTWN